ncbi:transcriptional regulator [Prescottella agglutinans]|nr:transcriptional regulator [Prescottella agglutinans]
MADEQHPITGLDDAVHQRVRLAIMTTLCDGIEVEFAYLRTTLGLTDGNLGRHLALLAERGYISVRKTYNGRRQRSWIQLTTAGEAALAAEAAVLRSILATIDDATNPR